MGPTPLTGVDTSIDGDFDHAAFVFKLEFGAPTWAAGSMINAARSIRTIKKYESDTFGFALTFEPWSP